MNVSVFYSAVRTDTLKTNIPRKVIRQLRYSQSCKYLTKTLKVVSVGVRDEIGARDERMSHRRSVRRDSGDPDVKPDSSP